MFNASIGVQVGVVPVDSEESDRGRVDGEQ
jgi:hypothetical protein